MGDGGAGEWTLVRSTDSVSFDQPVLAYDGELWSTRSLGSLMFSDTSFFIFDFDGSDNVRSLNRHAAELHPRRAPSRESDQPLNLEVLSALREAVQRCRVEGQACVNLCFGIPPRALSAVLTPSADASHFLIIGVDRESVSNDRLRPATVSAIAHHIRNPMAGIRGAVEVIGAELAHSSPDLASVVLQITQRIDDLDRSLDTMLSYLHPAALRLGSVGLGALLERIVAQEARPDPLRALDVRLDFDDVELVADADQLTHSVVNLLTNSAEALPLGRGQVKLTLSQDERFATIAVSDAAGGIPADVFPRVCEPFFTTKPRALGLGLTNARKVARAHGGDLTVRTVDGGTEVRLRLPRQSTGPE